MKVPVQAHDACFSGISREIFHGHLLGFNLTENELVNKTGKFQGKGAFLVISQVGLGVVATRRTVRPPLKSASGRGQWQLGFQAKAR